MKKKLLVLLAVLTLVVCMLVSCGKCEHETVGEDGKCTECGEQIKDPTPDPDPDPDPAPEPEHECVDANGDFVCDDPECGEPVIPPTPDRTGKTYAWDSANLKIQLNLHSSINELLAKTGRYMSGRDSEGAKIDDLVAERNLAAFNTTKIDTSFEYIADTQNWNGLGEQSWGAYFKSAIPSEQSTYEEGETADMYCGFAYDLFMGSAMGLFHNLMATSINGTEVKNYFTFLLDDYRPQFDEEGYIWSFMQSLTPLPETKMYVYASNYTMDVVRSIYCIPVGAGLLGSLDVADLPAGSDVDGDGTYEINEFYAMVRNMGWSYDTMAALCAAAFDPTTSQGGAAVMSDQLGFVMDAAMGLPGAAFVWSADFNWYDVAVKDGVPVYTLREDLGAIEALWAAKDVLLKKTDGVIGYNKDTNDIGISSAVDGIRQQFTQGDLLFGGGIVIGSLDHSDYHNMEDGFGVAPIPLYEITETSEYNTAIHNLARGLAISKSISPARFEQCTAFLDFQALNSDKVMNAYYESMKYETVGGEEYNIEMFEYLRDHIRSNADQYMDQAAANSTVVPSPDTTSGNDRFNKLFSNTDKDAISNKLIDGGVKAAKEKAIGIVVDRFVALP